MIPPVYLLFSMEYLMEYLTGYPIEYPVGYCRIPYRIPQRNTLWKVFLLYCGPLKLDTSLGRLPLALMGI